MERSTWTSERLDDLATGMREGFVRVDNDIRDVRGEIAELRSEMNEGFAQLRGEINDLRQMMFRAGGAMIATMCIGFLSVLVAILARGA